MLDTFSFLALPSRHGERVSVAAGEIAADRESDINFVRCEIRAYCKIRERLNGGAVKALQLDRPRIEGLRSPVTAALSRIWNVEMAATVTDRKLGLRPIRVRKPEDAEATFVPESLYVMCARLSGAKMREKADRFGVMKEYFRAVSWETIAKVVERDACEVKRKFNAAIPLMAEELRRRAEIEAQRDSEPAYESEFLVDAGYLRARDEAPLDDRFFAMLMGAGPRTVLL